MLLLLVALSTGAGWQAWAARNADAEWHEQLQTHLQQWFPEEISQVEGRHGFQHNDGTTPPDVVLIHGLDEPGGIWDELQTTLQQKGLVVWPFRYPNDQAIELSADFLAAQWSSLPADHPVVLVGHSMGGLVIRDFVTRHSPTTPSVHGVILMATPNHGSEWARFRVWLEVREQFTKMQRREFSLLAALQEGTGAAKVDLRPDSDFLQKLNARPWPAEIPIRLIGGVITEPTGEMQAGLNALDTELGPDAEAVTTGLRTWWHNLGQALGDGVVSVDSLKLPHTQDAPEPLLVPASHRGLLVSRDPQQPAPAIAPIVSWLEEWQLLKAP